MAEPKNAVVANSTAADLFADGVYSVSVRRNVARISFFSERTVPDGDGKSVHRVETGHVVMPMQGFMTLHARMCNVIEQMRQAGVPGFGTSAKADEATAATPVKQTAATAKKGKGKKK